MVAATDKILTLLGSLPETNRYEISLISQAQKCTPFCFHIPFVFLSSLCSLFYEFTTAEERNSQGCDDLCMMCDLSKVVIITESCPELCLVVWPEWVLSVVTCQPCPVSLVTLQTDLKCQTIRNVHMEGQ